MYVIMITMVIVIGTMLLTTHGVINENRVSLGFGMFLMILTLILEFIGSIVILVFGVEESDILIADLKEVFFKLIYRMDHDERANRILKIVQEYVSVFINRRRRFFLLKSYFSKKPNPKSLVYLAGKLNLNFITT